MDDIAIKVENLSKTFRLPHEKNTSIKSGFINLFRTHKKGYDLQHALKNVSLEIKTGDFYGIIGRNGSGKSTLLKLLAGIYSPTTGSVQVNGKLTPFIELGVGFNMELTGRENVYLNGALLGFNRKEMTAMYQEIVDFAELEKFMDQKLKNYSSGMQVRLAFSIAIRAKSDILLIDEVLAVGDANFQKKCLAVFEELKRQGRTIVFVSHSMGNIKDFCDKVAVINNGKVVFDGAPTKAINVYNRLNLDKEVEAAEAYNQQQKTEHLGSGGARIFEYGVKDKDGKKTKLIKSGDDFTAYLEIEYLSEVKDPVIGVLFRRTPAEQLYGMDNHFEDVKFGPKSKGDRSEVTFKTVMPLAPGDYFVSFSVIDAKSSTEFEDLDILDNVMKVTVFSEGEFWGLVKTPAKVEEKKR